MHRHQNHHPLLLRCDVRAKLLAMNARSEQVLDLVASEHIRTAKPVASAQIAGRLQVSSATVRNEFSALEEAGYLVQPHTSAGRIPTERGYRRYARKLIPPKRLSKPQQQFLLQSFRGVYGDDLLNQIARTTAELVGYTVVISLPPENTLRLLELHFSVISLRRVLAVAILEHGLVRQFALELTPLPAEADLEDVSLNLRRLQPPLCEVPEVLLELAKNSSSAQLYASLAASWPQLMAPRVLSQGLKNMLREPEAADPSFMAALLEAVEAPAAKATGKATDDVRSEPLSLNTGNALAMIAASLPLGSTPATLYVLGPLRMRYAESLMVASGVRWSLS